MAELAAVQRELGIGRQSGWPARKLGVFLAGGIAVTAVAGTLVYPYAAPQEEPRKAAEPPIVLLQTPPVAPPVQETVLRAPPLVEPAVPAPKPESKQRHVVRETSPPAPVEATVQPQDAVTAPPPEPEPAPPAPAAPAPPAPVDRFDPLRDALRSCAARDGLFERARCEQRARIDHCPGYWDQTPLCPSGRREHTQ